MSWKTHELTVGDLSQRSGVPASALRFYEREGLIHSRRTSGNQRRYTRDTLRRVAFVRSSQRVGVPLARIREVLALFPEDHVLTKEDWAQISERWREDLTERIEQLLNLRDSLTDCIGCGCLSIDKCALVNRYDTLGAQGPGARRLLKSCADSDGPGACGTLDQDAAGSANKAGVRSCSSDVPTGEAMNSVAPASTSSRNACSTVDSPPSTAVSCGPDEPLVDLAELLGHRGTAGLRVHGDSHGLEDDDAWRGPPRTGRRPGDRGHDVVRERGPARPDGDGAVGQLPHHLERRRAERADQQRRRLGAGRGDGDGAGSLDGLALVRHAFAAQ